MMLWDLWRKGQLLVRFAVGASLAVVVGVSLTKADDQAASRPSVRATRGPGISLGAKRESGIVFGPFPVSPSLSEGGIYNNDLNATPTISRSGLGLRAAPEISALSGEGLHKAMWDLSFDGQWHPGDAYDALGAGGQSSVSMFAVEHLWKPMQDVTVGMSANNCQRQNGFFTNVMTGATTLVMSKRMAQTWGI